MGTPRLLPSPTFMKKSKLSHMFMTMGLLSPMSMPRLPLRLMFTLKSKPLPTCMLISLPLPTCTPLPPLPQLPLPTFTQLLPTCTPLPHLPQLLPLLPTQLPLRSHTPAMLDMLELMLDNMLELMPILDILMPLTVNMPIPMPHTLMPLLHPPPLPLHKSKT